MHPLNGLRCATPGCSNPLTDTWGDTGRVCAQCAIENDLFCRDARSERAMARRRRLARLAASRRP